MNEAEKTHLKLSALEALASTEMNIVRVAASCISSICIHEIPKGRWLEVLEVLCSNCTYEDRMIRVASILTLGYICEELMHNELSKDHADFVLTALLESLENNYQDKDIIEQTIQGIYHSLKFTVSHFQDGHGKMIIDKIIAATSYPLVKVREIAMQCIVEIVRLCYPYIKDFMGDISEATLRACDKDETEVKTQAIEIWSSIAEEENMREEKGIDHLGLTNIASNMLIELLMNTIQDLNIGNEAIDEDQEWGTSVAAGCCLSLCSLVLKDKIVEPIIDFVAENIKENRQWEKRYCGIVALGAILEGPSKDKLQGILKPAVQTLMDLIGDNHPRVRSVSCWLFTKIGRLHHELITDKDVFPSLYSRLIDGLKEEPVIASNIATIIAEIAEALLNTDIRVHSCILSECFEELTNSLLTFILREDLKTDLELHKVRVSGFSALYNLLQYAPSDCENFSLDFMTNVYNMLESSVAPGMVLDSKQEELQGFFLCALQCILTNVSRKIEEKVGMKIVDLIIDVFRQRKDIFDEAFLALSAIANKFPDALGTKVDELGSFLMLGLQSKNSAIIRNSCGVLSDLCTLVESPSIHQGFKEYIPLLLGHLKDKDTDKYAKIIIITLIGDTFLLTKEKFEEFLEESLEVLESAAHVAVMIPENYQDMPEYMAYLANLQSGLVESYT